MKWTKIIISCCIIFIIACRKVEVRPEPQPINKDIFAKSEVSVVDGQDIQFNLVSAGKYTLTLFDSTKNQVISRERFAGIIGDNIKKIYTKSLSQKSLYLYLTDQSNNRIKQTKITIN